MQDISGRATAQDVKAAGHMPHQGGVAVGATAEVDAHMQEFVSLGLALEGTAADAYV